MVLDVQPLGDGRVEAVIPFDSYTVDGRGTQKPAYPGVRGQLRFVISAWNTQVRGNKHGGVLNGTW